MCCHRGAYDNKTIPESKPYEDGLKVTVRHNLLSVCVCMCVCMRACVRVCMYVCVRIPNLSRGLLMSTCNPGPTGSTKGENMPRKAFEWNRRFHLCRWSRYGDFTTQSGISEGLWFENGTVQSQKVKMLSRSYAQVPPCCVCSLHLAFGVFGMPGLLIVTPI